MKTLVICTWFDGGPDTDCEAHKILDENFNEVPEVKIDCDIALWDNESSDVKESIYAWHLTTLELQHLYPQYASYADEYKKAQDLWDAWEKFCDDRKAFYGDEYWSSNEKEHPEDVAKSATMFREAIEYEGALKDKYRGVEIGSYYRHVMGLNEYCKLNGIDKVISLCKG